MAAAVWGKMCVERAGMRRLWYVGSLRASASTPLRQLTVPLRADLQQRVDPRPEEANRHTECCAISRISQVKQAAQFNERVADRSIHWLPTLPTRPQSGIASSQQPRGGRRRSFARPRRGSGSRLGFYPPASLGNLVSCSFLVVRLLNRGLQGRLRRDRMRSRMR